MKRSITALLLLFIVFGCIDRLIYEVPSVDSFGISISGHISNEPGPYRVNIFRNFDIDSRETTKTGVTARSVVISDAEGNSESLSQVRSGIYETSATGIRGKIGGIYKLTVELPDGRKYESLPDTLLPGGTIDSVYYDLKGRAVEDGYIYEFFVYLNSRTEADPAKTHFMWGNKTTYKAETKPLLEAGPPPGPCYMRPDGQCNFVALCSGYYNIGWGPVFIPESIGPCECCTCWYDIYNQGVLLNDNFSSMDGKYSNILVDRIELTGWLMQDKMRLEVKMQSLSPQAYQFWKGVRDQRSAVNNIFQPITGKISGNLRQSDGPVVPVQGIFYASAMSTRALWIDRDDINNTLIPSTTFPGAGAFPCYKLAPNSTTTQPSFWID